MKGKISQHDIQWPCELSEQVKEELLGIACLKEDIDALGGNPKLQMPEGIVYLYKGIVAITLWKHDMSGSIGSSMGPQDWFGTMSLDPLSQAIYSMEEIETVAYLLFPRERVLALTKGNNEVYKWLFTIAQNVIPKCLQISLTSIHDKEIRVVYALLNLLAQQPCKKGGVPCVRVSQQQLAQISGISRQRVNEVLKQMECADEVQIERGLIHIVDLTSLAKRLENINISYRDPRKLLNIL